MITPENDPYTQPSFSLSNRVVRALWGVVWLLLFRPSPRPFHIWRSFLLRLFGAKIGASCAIYPSAKIWGPWNLVCEDTVAVAEGVEIYNPAIIKLRSHAIISQGAYLCGATHDLHSQNFAMVSKEIEIGAYAWVCSRAVIMPGVKLGDGAVLALAGVATKDIPAWKIYGGVPAKEIGTRSQR
jgi:putative colanic acid biosynthesis acetyltransferase WcaF